MTKWKKDIFIMMSGVIMKLKKHDTHTFLLVEAKN
jgi:hypothetical protein